MLKELIENYKPSNMQEEADQKVMLKYIETFDDVLTRNNVFGHFTSSAFVVNKKRTKVLMAYHKIYDSYAFLGGHADGNEDMQAVAIREAKEETSLKKLTLLKDEPISLEVIEVAGHIKKGAWVTSHVHLNVTYLMEASEQDFITNKEDENSSVAWIPLDELKNYVTEPKMLPIYEKIKQKMQELITNN